MSHRASLVIAFSLGFFALLGQANAQTPPPKPGPEVKKLGMMVGKFANEGQMKAGALGPNSPAQKATGIDDCKWIAGGFGVLCNSTVEMGGSKASQVSIFYYDPATKTYHYHSIDSTGGSESSQGTVNGDTWTWIGEVVEGGKVVHNRFIMKPLSKDSFEYTVESGDNDASMKPVMSGKETRVTTAAKPATSQ